MYNYSNKIIIKQAKIIEKLQEELLERAKYETSLLKTIVDWEKLDIEDEKRKRALAELRIEPTESYLERQRELEEYTQLSGEERRNAE